MAGTRTRISSQAGVAGAFLWGRPGFFCGFGSRAARAGRLVRGPCPSRLRSPARGHFPHAFAACSLDVLRFRCSHFATRLCRARSSPPRTACPGDFPPCASSPRVRQSPSPPAHPHRSLGTTAAGTASAGHPSTPPEPPPPLTHPRRCFVIARVGCGSRVPAVGDPAPLGQRLSPPHPGTPSAARWRRALGRSGELRARWVRRARARQAQGEPHPAPGPRHPNSGQRSAARAGEKRALRLRPERGPKNHTTGKV